MSFRITDSHLDRHHLDGYGIIDNKLSRIVVTRKSIKSTTKDLGTLLFLIFGNTIQNRFFLLNFQKRFN